MLVDTSDRSTEAEQLDDFSLSGIELDQALDKIASINRLLGGNQVTLSGVNRLLKTVPTGQTINIVDVGCGNGDMLRALAKYARKENRVFMLKGIDANAAAIFHANALSGDFPEISYSCSNFLTSAGSDTYDIVLCTLTLHHFSDKEIENLLHVFSEKATLGVVINDLHRHRLAYYLFKLICFVFNLSELSRNDGLISILRGFKRKDLTKFSRELNPRVSIRWKWAFRYQWIIPTI